MHTLEEYVLTKLVARNNAIAKSMAVKDARRTVMSGSSAASIAHCNRGGGEAAALHLKMADLRLKDV